MRCLSTPARTVIARAIGRALLLAACGFGSAVANAVTIAPVVVELSAARKVVSVTVTNPTDSAMSFQAEVLAWSQPDGKDVLEPTNALMVVPPVAQIAAGASQIFRVTPRTPPSPQEQAYRLVLEDVTAAIAGPANSATINLRVRHSLPVFVAAAGTQTAAVRVEPCAAPAGKGCVRLSNDGNRYITAKTITVAADAWQTNVPASTRLLAGAWREWRFDLPAKVAGPLSVKVETSAGPFDGVLATLPR